MKKILFAALSLGFLMGTAQIKVKGLMNKDSLAKKTKELKGGSKLSNEEVVKGLKEALSVGTNNSSSMASKVDGFYKNPRLFIPWPEEAKEMKARLIKMGFSKKIEEFETSLNRAAEEAALKAAPVFVDAITNMSVQDGFAVLNGADTAATNYLRKTTYAPLKTNFLPVVKEAIEKVNVTNYWNPLVTAYNKIPGVKKQNLTLMSMLPIKLLLA